MSDFPSLVPQGGLDPHPPASGWKAPVREWVRKMRLWKLQRELGARLQVGNHVIFGPNAHLRSPDLARFGNNVSTGKDLTIECNVEIGDDVLISSRVSFVGNDHRFDNPELSVFWSGRLPACTVILEGDNLIGYGAILVGNVRVGHGCIVGAGAVVVKDLPPNTICVGVPAKPIRARFLNQNEVHDGEASSLLRDSLAPGL